MRIDISYTTEGTISFDVDPEEFRALSVPQVWDALLKQVHASGCPVGADIYYDDLDAAAEEIHAAANAASGECGEP